jgi:hypothetical protein
MRWDGLFDDLEGQLEHGLDAEQLEVRAEDERLRVGRLSVRDRLAALSRGRSGPVELRLRDGSILRLLEGSCGRDWIAGDVDGAPASRRAALVPVAAVAAALLDPASVRTSLVEPPRERVALDERVGLAFALRDLCRRRRAVEVHASWGRLHGTVDRVGRDHLDLAVHDADEPRRGGAVRSTAIVAFDAILVVRF